MTDALLLDRLDVAYRVGGRDRAVLRDLSLRIGRGESYGLVGESGCGKSTAAMAALRYLPRNGRVTGGAVVLDGSDVYGLGREALRAMRAHKVSMVYQDPGTALNPTLTIGRQVAEAFALLGFGRDAARTRAAEMLGRVRISDPAAAMLRYPHQLSGGMQQRVAIAMALAKDPAMLILDEPTTGLDATVEAEVLDLIADLRRSTGSSVLFISHNLAVIAQMCDRVGVLYAGMLVEEGPASRLFADPRHPYTVALLRCLPRHGQRKDQGLLDTIQGDLPAIGAALAGCPFAPRCALADARCRSELPALTDLGGRLARCHYPDRAPDLPRGTTGEGAPRRTPPAGQAILRLDAVSKTFGTAARPLHAVDAVSLDLMAGETLGLVGESGSGKTTLARIILGLLPPDQGSGLMLDGATLAPLLDNRTRDQVKAVQIVFQNPDSALNRAHTIGRILGRALRRLAGLTGAALRARRQELVDAVRLNARHLGARPRQLSGGLKQRVAIARAFAGDPRVVVCDEPTSALDVSVQAAILNLLADLQARREVAFVFISHDLGVVRYLSDRIAVLYLGRLLEIGPSERVFSGPHHPYTAALLSAVPQIDGSRGGRIRLDGEIPGASTLPAGCVFHSRCPRKLGAICESETPPEIDAGPGHVIRCHLGLADLPRTAPARDQEPAQ